MGNMGKGSAESVMVVASMRMVTTCALGVRKLAFLKAHNVPYTISNKNGIASDRKRYTVQFTWPVLSVILYF